jgi:hypothetical protein
MSRHSYISTTFWADRWIQSLDPSEKYVFLYLMTNGMTNISGVYKISDKQISFDTGYNQDAIRGIIHKFSEAGKVYRMDEYIILTSWPKHQNWKTKDSIRVGIEKELNSLSDDELRYVYLSGYKFPMDEILAQRGVDPPTVPPPSMVGVTYSILSYSITSKFNSNSSGCAESDVKESLPEKPKKLPLREREPVNDMEKVEKAYLQNWDTLYAQGKVKTPEPVINWNQTRALLKKHFEKLRPEQIIQALKSGMTDDFILSGGYSFGVMLSASVLNRLVNAGGAGPPKGLNDKKSLKGLTEWD